MILVLMLCTGEKLEAEATAQYEGPRQSLYLCALTKVCGDATDFNLKANCIQDNNVFSNLDLHFDRNLRQYRLLNKGNIHDSEEITLRLTGIIVRCQLPPLRAIPPYVLYP
jgi:hypothetical protein